MIPLRRLSSVALLASLAVFCGACAPEVITPPAVTTTATPTEDRLVVPSPPEDPLPEVAWPLTGLSAVGATQEALDSPAIPIKIENTSKGRPQKGLEFADIVFEEYINSNCTRLMAVYQSTYPDDVGPIRSARTMDPNIMGSFNTVLVASGCNFAVQKVIRNKEQLLFADDFSPTTGYLQGSEGFTRMPRSVVDKDQEFRLWGHPAIFAAEAIEEGMGATPQQFDYAYPAEAATATVEGTAVGTIDLKYSNCAHPHWVWDETEGVWDRFEFEDPHMTWDGVQITSVNVVVLRVKVAYTQGYNPESFVIVTEPQPGYVATGGRILPILWTKSGQRDSFHFTTLDGDPVYLAPGNTWIELVPLSGAYTKAVITFDGVVQ